jgi:hypothetical protein
MRKGQGLRLGLALLGMTLGGCSLQSIAVDAIGDSLAGSGGSFASERDPELVREALPFGLKTIEGLLEASPEHEGLLLAAAEGFCAYAYLLKEEADRREATDLAAARDLRGRSRGFFLRGRDYALRALDGRHESFTATLRTDAAAALPPTTKDDAAFLYWAGAGWAGALSADKGDLDLLAELPLAGALVGQVAVLDEGYDAGAAYEFLLSYEAGRPGGDLALARAHYERALALSQGKRASLYLGLAESVALTEANAVEFAALLDSALAVDIDAVPQWRLVNVLAQRRALWLRARMPELFIDFDDRESGA